MTTITLPRAVKLLAALIAPSLLCWAAVGFVAWNWSPETWSETMRATFVWVSFMLTMPAVAIVKGIT